MKSCSYKAKKLVGVWSFCIGINWELHEVQELHTACLVPLVPRAESEDICPLETSPLQRLDIKFLVNHGQRVCAEFPTRTFHVHYRMIQACEEIEILSFA